MSDWNTKIIAEFRANEGRVGGNFEGAPIVVVHHRGRKSGREYINPMMYLPHDTEQDIIYVFATKAGAPSNPDWYHNLVANPAVSVEIGTETIDVTARVAGADERQAIFDAHKAKYTGFADYEKKTSRVIPVVILHRAG